MAAMRLSAKMDRTDSGTPWGFRMTGGKDFGAPLVIQRVSHGVYGLDISRHDLLLIVCNGIWHLLSNDRMYKSPNYEIRLLQGGSKK